MLTFLYQTLKNAIFYDQWALHVLLKHLSIFWALSHIQGTARYKQWPKCLSLGCLQKRLRRHLCARGHSVCDFGESSMRRSRKLIFCVVDRPGWMNFRLFRLSRRSQKYPLAGPMGLAAAVSGPAENGGFLWVVKIRSAHFRRRGSKAIAPMS
jgi:hypothetical protein